MVKIWGAFFPCDISQVTYLSINLVASHAVCIAQYTKWAPAAKENNKKSMD